MVAVLKGFLGGAGAVPPPADVGDHPGQGSARIAGFGTRGLSSREKYARGTNVQNIDLKFQSDFFTVLEVAVISTRCTVIQVAELTCTMSNNPDGVKMVRYAIGQIRKLAPQVVNAARLLAARPQSLPAQNNMDAFCDAWNQSVRVLTLAVDSMITLDDFIAVSEAHIVEDVKTCIEALVSCNQMQAENRENSIELFDRAAGAIRGRSLRVCDVVEAEMEFRQPDAYVDRVRQAVTALRNDALPDFAHKAELDVEILKRPGQQQVDTDEFINSATTVHSKMLEIRHAILMNRDLGDIDSDEEYEEDFQKTDKSGYNQNSGNSSQQENQQLLMKKLPEEDKKKINEQIQVFKIVQHKFEREVARWEETGNDVVVLAKYMCLIMMDMTDFTRGRGPLKTTMDVINAAKKISEAGTKLNALAKQIADESVESETKKDLLAYLQRITLYCQQLNITSKVKADVQEVEGELIVSGLESAMSLIQASKNLLNAVILAVKAAYIASTKYPSKGSKQSSLVVWKMRGPDKKPLVRKEEPSATIVGKSAQSIIRRSSQRREMPPIKVLADFSNNGCPQHDAKSDDERLERCNCDSRGQNWTTIDTSLNVDCIYFPSKNKIFKFSIGFDKQSV
uniref:Catenin alpha-2 n=1 Tax=Romanomermis culicivorax TaxID=13658 RepID=A0A915LA29_ROMCU